MDHDYFTVGYVDFPGVIHKPAPGTDAETYYSRGWLAAQRTYESQLSLDLNFDSELGRETFAAEYHA